MTDEQRAELAALNDYVAEVEAEMDPETCAAWARLSRDERQAMMWTGFHLERRIAAGRAAG